MNALLLAAACALLSPQEGFAKTNIAVVTEGALLRGSQPKEKDIQELKRRGVASIVNLRRGNIQKERSMVERNGLLYHSIPVRDRGVPNFGQVYEFLRFATLRDNQPVFVHCQKGKGRTGIMVAIFRIAAEGWDVGKALAEARRFGLTSKKQIDFVKKFAYEFNQSRDPMPVTTRPRCPPNSTELDQCLPSCGQAGGTASFGDPCENHGMTSAGEAWDVPFCCK